MVQKLKFRNNRLGTQKPKTRDSQGKHTRRNEEDPAMRNFTGGVYIGEGTKNGLISRLGAGVDRSN